MSNVSSRNPYFDFLRGLAIIMVVGIHTFRTHDLTLTSFVDVCNVLLRLILNCAVPLFLAISGFFIGNRNISFGKEHLKFLKHQVPKVYIPCLIFSVPYLIMALYTDTNHLLRYFVFFFACGFSVYYFIALIIQYYLLLPFLSKCNKCGGGGTGNIYQHCKHFDNHISI